MGGQQCELGMADLIKKDLDVDFADLLPVKGDYNVGIQTSEWDNCWFHIYGRRENNKMPKNINYENFKTFTQKNFTRVFEKFEIHFIPIKSKK